MQESERDMKNPFRNMAQVGVGMEQLGEVVSEAWPPVLDEWSFGFQIIGVVE